MVYSNDKTVVKTTGLVKLKDRVCNGKSKSIPIKDWSPSTKGHCMVLNSVHMHVRRCNLP